MKTRHGTSKYILKKAVEGLIPDELIHRKKQGFGVPIHDWFAGRLGDEMRREVNDFANQSGLLNSTYVNGLFEKAEYGYRLWYLYNLALWWKTYIA